VLVVPLFYISLLIEQSFINNEGSPVVGFNITLTPKDFCPSALLPIPELCQQALVTFQGTHLFQKLDRAKRRVASSATGVKDVLPPSTRKRKMSSSSIEELSETDEAVIQNEEERVARIVSDEDADYVPSPRWNRASATRLRRN